MHAEASQRGLEPDSTSYAHAIEALVKAQEAEQAARLMQNMTEAGHQPQEALYMSVIQLCSDRGVDITTLRRLGGGMA